MCGFFLHLIVCQVQDLFHASFKICKNFYVRAKQTQKSLPNLVSYLSNRILKAQKLAQVVLEEYGKVRKLWGNEDSYFKGNHRVRLQTWVAWGIKYGRHVELYVVIFGQIKIHLTWYRSKYTLPTFNKLLLLYSSGHNFTSKLNSSLYYSLWKHISSNNNNSTSPVPLLLLLTGTSET